MSFSFCLEWAVSHKQELIVTMLLWGEVSSKKPERDETFIFSQRNCLKTLNKKLQLLSEEILHYSIFRCNYF